MSEVLSALRTLPMVEGVPVLCLHNELVSVVLHGKVNFEEEQKSAVKRQPVTLKVMHLLEVTLKLTWAMASVAFNCCFRCGELLVP